MVRNAFFRSDWRTRTWSRWQEGVHSLQALKREDYIYPYDIRSKYFVWSKAAVMIGIHFPYELVNASNANVQTVHVNETEGLLHHYRGQTFEADAYRSSDVALVDDRTMLKYRNKLLRRIRQRRNRLVDEAVAPTDAIARARR
jgi:hypothetical protein